MIRFVFRWAFRLVLLAIVLAVALVLLKDTLARNYLEAHIRQETGFDAKIGRLEFSLFAPTLTIENFVLYNPPEFGGSPCLDMPQFHVEYSRDELPFHRLHFKLLRLDIRELNIVLDQQGRTNLVELMRKTGSLDSTNYSPKDYTFSGADMLNLSMGRVRYTDLRFPKRNQELKLAIKNETIPNVRSEEDLAAILFRVLLRAGITVYLEPHTAHPSGKH